MFVLLEAHNYGEREIGSFDTIEEAKQIIEKRYTYFNTHAEDTERPIGDFVYGWFIIDDNTGEEIYSDLVI